LTLNDTCNKTAIEVLFSELLNRCSYEDISTAEISTIHLLFSVYGHKILDIGEYYRSLLRYNYYRDCIEPLEKLLILDRHSHKYSY